MEQPGWLDNAWSFFGQRERTGTEHNKVIVDFFRDAGHSYVRDDETAWCAAFVGACLARADIAPTGSLRARSYLNWGVAIDEPRAGAVAVFSRGRNPALGHVGFVVGSQGSQILVLGGNQNDAVTIAGFPRSRLLGLRWPGNEVPAQSAAGETFEDALRHVLEMEGDYTNDPDDPGGPTNKGITLKVYAAWQKTPLTNATRARLIGELKKIPIKETAEIYRQRYWRKAGCDELPPALAFMHFDAAVNHGVGTAIRTLQEAVGARIDGEIGPETKAKISTMPVLKILERYAAIRNRRYRALHHFWKFGRGWLSRVKQTHARARDIAKGARPATNTITKGKTKMTTKTKSAPIGKWWGESMTIWGALITAMATVLPALGPIVGLDVTGELVRQLGGQVVEVIQAIGGVIGTIMTIYGRGRATQPLVRQELSVMV